jgi:glycerol-3-phosphate dehydrogenase
LKPAVTRTTRAEAIARLRSETFDVLILGGGINGAGVARDLALRSKIAGAGLKIALVEQSHFSSGASGKNSHLIHGGLRYLKQLDVGLVRESLRERETLLRIAPHLVTPLPFLMPLAGIAKSIFYNAGLAIYDSLAGASLPHHRHLALEEVRGMEPALAVPGMTGAAEYYDAQVQSSRLVLENVFEAIANGVACANYVRAESPSTLRDTISGETFEIRARAIVNATGPWAHDPQPRLVRGSHIIYPRLNRSDHAIAYFEESGRIIFFIPWGDRTLVGTTDVDHEGSPDQVEISEAETHYLRAIAATVFPVSASMEPVASFSALRPLLPSHGSATRASRDHRIFHDSAGILHITGGKFTTYRAMSEEAADMVTEKVAPTLRRLRVTADHPLNGNSRESLEALLAEAPELAGRYSLEQSQIIALVHQYGVLAPVVLDCMPERDYCGLPRVDAARLIYAVRHEMAQQREDVLTVSTTLGFEGREALLTPDAWTLATSL